LPCALDRQLALAAADGLLAGSERRLRAVLDRLEVLVLEPAAWLPVDPDAGWTRDVDAPEDLATGGGP
jgi:hypothetical protein